jgi:putative ABC transport system permease protein
MSLALRPILSALLRSRSGATLIAVQVAVALAVMVNALYLVQQHLERISRPTRIDEANLFGVYSVEFAAHFDYDASLRADLSWLRSLPGVVAAAPTNSIPLGIAGGGKGLWTQPEQRGNQAEVNYFDMDEQGLAALGVRLLAGRPFRADEILPPTRATDGDSVPQLIVTRATARRLFPGGDALGRTVYDAAGSPTLIVGIIDDMIGTGWWGYQSVVQVAIEPRLPRFAGFAYLVRTAPGRRDALMRQVEEHLAASNQDRVIRDVRSVEYNKRLLYESDRGVGTFLAAVSVLMLALTALGIFALATFQVAARTRQIGTRRAVGARRRDIVRHFLLENGLITGAGIVAGCVLALATGLWLSSMYALPRLPLYYLAGGALVIGAVGQAAAWLPARRAAAVPPSVAARTV